jgi:hypothetical protein
MYQQFSAALDQQIGFNFTVAGLEYSLDSSGNP